MLLIIPAILAQLVVNIVQILLYVLLAPVIITKLVAYVCLALTFVWLVMSIQRTIYLNALLAMRLLEG